MRSCFFLIVLLILSLVEGIAQKPQKDQLIDQLDREEQERKLNELQERIAEHISGTRFSSGPDNELLPEGPTAWVLHVVTTGGFTGQGLPTLTIRSTSDFACGEDASLKFLPLDPARFQLFWAMVTNADLKVVKSSPKTQSSTDFVCNDCYRTSMFLTRRENDGKIRFYRSSDNTKYANYVASFAQMRQRSTELADCTDR